MRGSERREGENAGRRETAGISDDFRVLDGRAIELGETIDARGVAVRVLDVIPGLIDSRVSKPEIRAEVDDARRQVLEGFADLHRMAMRQADEDEIAVTADGLDVLHAFERQVIETSQMRIERGDGLARVALRCDVDDLCLRVAVENPEKLRPRISGRAKNADLFCHTVYLLRAAPRLVLMHGRLVN